MFSPKSHFLRYADRLHSAYLTLQCQKEGSMGERLKSPQARAEDKFAWIMPSTRRLPEKESFCFRQHWGVA